MKIFIARDKQDTLEGFAIALRQLRNQVNTKVYLIGELGYDWELVDRYNLDGMVNAPQSLKSLIAEPIIDKIKK